jgi:hypothetical protein
LSLAPTTYFAPLASVNSTDEFFVVSTISNSVAVLAFSVNFRVRVTGWLELADKS